MNLGFFTMPVHPQGRNYAETLKEDREAFILADRLGYTEGYCGEHLTDEVENIPNSMMFIATLLGATKQIKLGTAVINLPHSHPAIIASNAAMIDNLFEGRFIMGIGAGVLRSDAEALGILDQNRQEMFVEAIDQVLAIWASDPPYNIKGKYWTISTEKTLWPEVGVGSIVKPYQKPHPPIVGTASDPDSKGLIALGKRGWGPVSSNLLHANCLGNHWVNYAKGAAEGGHPADRAIWRVGALDLRRRRRQDGAVPTAAMTRKARIASTSNSFSPSWRASSAWPRSRAGPTCRTPMSRSITWSTTW